jgi:hypothetical protein
VLGFGRRVQPELGRVGPSHHDQAGGAEPFDQPRVGGCDVATLGEEAGPGVVRVTGRARVEVLQHEGHTGERPVRQRPARLVEGPFEAPVDDGVQLGVEPLDPIDRGLDQLHRLGLTAADQFGLGSGI